MKRLYYIWLTALLLAGCQDELLVRNAERMDGLTTKAGETVTRIDEPYIFLAQKNFKAFTDIETLDDRFAACEVPEDTLKAMTTDALVRTALNYPLNFIYSAYNDPYYAVKLIVKNSALHRELIGRRDAAEVLLQHFAKTTMNMDTTAFSVFNRSETCLTYANEMFFEYLLTSGLVPGLDEGKNYRTLCEIACRKVAEREADSETYSELSVAPLETLLGNTRSGDQDNAPEEQGRYYSIATWHTPFGQDLTVGIEYEMSPTEIYQVTTDYSLYYPNATVIANASKKYNGNGYAWIKTDPTMSNYITSQVYNSWLTYNYSGTDHQMTKLWSNDFYVTATVSDAKNIYYLSADQSAVQDMASSNYYSKWGIGPLMLHAPTYCPYNTSSPSYYKIRTSTASFAFTIDGPDAVQANASNYYYPQPYNPDDGRLSVSWTVENLTTHDPSTYSFNHYGTSHLLTCTEAWSTYKMFLEGYYGTTLMFQAVKTITCFP